MGSECVRTLEGKGSLLPLTGARETCTLEGIAEL
jgi:hypothetical protein